MAVVVLFTSLDGPVTVTLAAGIMAPLSSVTWPRKAAVWANSAGVVNARASIGRMSFSNSHSNRSRSEEIAKPNSRRNPMNIFQRVCVISAFAAGAVASATAQTTTPSFPVPLNSLTVTTPMIGDC